MQHTVRRHVATLAAAGAAALLVAGCSVDSLLERGLSMVEGVEGVEIDREGGSFSISSEEGELFAIDIDEEEGTASFSTEEGSVTTGQASELPPEIAAVFTPPPGFEVQAVSDMSSTEEGRGLLAQGEITGEWSTLMDALETEMESGPWDQVQRQVMESGVMGVITGAREDGGGTLNASLVMEEDTEEGMLSLLLVIPADDTPEEE